jgi:hypothetical protein
LLAPPCTALIKDTHNETRAFPGINVVCWHRGAPQLVLTAVAVVIGCSDLCCFCLLLLSINSRACLCRCRRCWADIFHIAHNMHKASQQQQTCLLFMARCISMRSRCTDRPLFCPHCSWLALKIIQLTTRSLIRFEHNE